MSFIDDYPILLPEIVVTPEEEERKRQEEEDRKRLEMLIAEQEDQTGLPSPYRLLLRQVDGDYPVESEAGVALPEPVPEPVPEPDTSPTPQPTPQPTPDITSLLEGYDKPITPPRGPLLPPPRRPIQDAEDVVSGTLWDTAVDLGRGFAPGASPEEQNKALMTGTGMALGGPIGRGASAVAAGAANILSPYDPESVAGLIQNINPISPAQAQARPNPQQRERIRAREEAARLKFELDALGLDNPSVTHTLETDPSPSVRAKPGKQLAPAQVPQFIQDYMRDEDSDRVIPGGAATFGGLAVASAIGAFAPKIYRIFKTGTVPKLLRYRDVPDAKPGTQAVSTPGDYARSIGDDINAGPLRILKRVGGHIDPRAVDEVAKTFTFQTRGQARAVADAAIVSGHAETIAYSFRSKVPLAQLARRDDPRASQYMHILDTINDIKIESLRRLGTKGPAQPGPIVIRGLDLTQANGMRLAMEKTTPGLKEFAKDYRDNLKNYRDFLGNGEYSLLTKGQVRFLNKHRPDEVPTWGPSKEASLVKGDIRFRQRPKSRVVDDPRVERGQATQSLGREFRVGMRRRMENEAVGLFVDIMRKFNPRLFVPITKEEWAANPHWHERSVSFYRRGKLEHYSTDIFLAGALRMDPYYFHSVLGQAAYKTKRLMEITTTGPLAPYFASTSLLRNHLLQKFAADQGIGHKSSNVLTTAYAIPRQLIPQIANAFNQTLNRSAVGPWLDKTFQGPAFRVSLSNKLAHAYENSLYQRMQATGGTKGSILEQQVDAQHALKDAIETVHPMWRGVLNGYHALLQSMHNAPHFGYAGRNIGKASDIEIAARARGLTGDNTVGGQFMTGKGGGRYPIQFEDETSRVRHTLGKVAKVYGAGTEVGRNAIPWWNPMMQGIKRVGESYLDNPMLFTGQAWLYAIMPSAAAYYLARSMGDDPNGVNYADYAVNRRSDYAKTMNIYIPVPGRPAEKGIEHPVPHEFSILNRLSQVAMHHAFDSPVFKESEAFKQAASSFLGVVAEPPLPPLVSLGLASQGMSPGMGTFSGEAYRRRVDPYDQTGGLPTSIELYTRAIAPGLSDIAGQGAAAMIQTPNAVSDRDKALSNFLSGASKRLIAKAPYVRDVFNIHAPMTGSTNISTEAFKKQRVINDLVKYYGEWDAPASGRINVKPQSVAGGEIAEQLLGPMPQQSTERGPTGQQYVPRIGLSQPLPTNPLYREYMEEVRNKFIRDTPEAGGIGFRSLWRRYGDATKQLSSLRIINDGNNTTWQKRLEAEPAVKKWLEQNNISTTNPREARTFFENERHNTLRVILNTMRAVEADISKRRGKPFKIEDLDPYRIERALTPGFMEDPESTVIERAVGVYD